MNDLTTIAHRLRAVRKSQTEFLARWAAESLIDRPIVLDGVLGAIEPLPRAATIDTGMKDMHESPAARRKD